MHVNRINNGNIQQKGGVKLSNIACVRGDKMLFSRLSLTISSGQVVQISGANGMGKSSLIRIIAGLLAPYAGERQVDIPFALSDEKLALDDNLTLYQALSHWRSWTQNDAVSLDEALQLMHIGHLRNIAVRCLSTGQRKRASLARVIALNCPLWLLDEPVNGLDSDSIAALGKVMSGHLANGGMIICASHQPLPLDNITLVNLQDYIPQ